MPSIASLLTCTRASSGYYQNADGTLHQFGANVLRYGTNGLLVEEARTNGILQSQVMSNASWTNPSNIVVTDNNTIAPDGTTTAAKLAENAATNSFYFLGQSFTPLNATTYTWSAYVKVNTRTWTVMQLTIGGLNVSCTFDLSNGVVGVAGNTTGTITALANGWYRCSITGLTVSAAAGEARIWVNSSDTVGTHVGVVGNSIFAWGAQLEVGAFATSYIPTTTVSVTRAADNIGFVSTTWLSSNVGTFYAQAIISASVVIASSRLWGGGSNSSAPLFIGSNTTVGLFNNPSGINTATAGSGGWSTVAKAAAAASDPSASNSVCMNNGVVATAAYSFGLNDVLKLGSDTGTANFLNGYMKRVAYYNTKLSNTNLAAITV